MIAIRRHPSGLVLALGLLALGRGPALAENVDPDSEGLRYAWSENLGWIDAEPLGQDGPGMQVDDFELTGWLWSENAGWISLSCKNTASCDRVPYGIRNDGSGNLSGTSWGENVGWIRFDHAQGHVVVDIENGMLYGFAWGENVGWIRMSSDAAPNPYGIRSGWSCSPPPAVPDGRPDIRLGKDGDSTVVEWGAVEGAAGYDLVYGSLLSLRSEPHDFAVATLGCAAENLTTTETRFDPVPTIPDPYWLLVRPVNCGGAGTYDDAGPGLAGPRDPGIEAALETCMAP